VRTLLVPVAVCGLLLAASPVIAQEEPAEACAAIADDGPRLACYDGIFRNGGDLPGDEIEIQSERMIPALPSGRAPATMLIACEAGQPKVSFAFAGQLVSNTGDIAPVTFQVDQNGTSVRTLTASSDNRTLSFGAGSESDAFLDGLAAGTNLKVRMTPVRQRSVTVDFRLPDHTEQIAELLSGCK
jgi:hypothetical protein